MSNKEKCLMLIQQICEIRIELEKIQDFLEQKESELSKLIGEDDGK